MKRLLPLLLALLLLTACGAAPAAEPTPEPTSAPKPQQQPEVLPAPSAEPDEDELPTPPAEETPAEAPALSDTEVTLDGLSSYLRLTLPQGWTWEQAGGTQEGTVYALYPESDPDFKVELRHWNEGFPGLCGTGMSFSEYTLSDGRTATLAYETVDGSIWWWLILPESPDSFSLQFGADTAIYEAHRAELELMMGTIRQGVLAGLDVVTPQTATG